MERLDYVEKAMKNAGSNSELKICLYEDGVYWNLSPGVGVFMDSLINSSNPKRKFNMELTYMEPQEVLDVFEDIFIKRGYSEGVLEKRLDVSHMKDIKSMMANEKPFNTITLVKNKRGQYLDYQEGQHRMEAAKNLGVRRVPVWIATENRDSLFELPGG